MLRIPFTIEILRADWRPSFPHLNNKIHVVSCARLGVGVGACRSMHENVPPIRGNEAVTLDDIEPFDGAGGAAVAASVFGMTVIVL